MALGDKVEELQQTVSRLVSQVAVLQKAVDALEVAHGGALRELAEARREHADVRREHEKVLVLLERDSADFKKWKDDHKKEREEQARKLWSFGPNVLGAVINGLIAAVVAFFISRR
jgi:chromosome segregation ATPase